MLFMNATRKQKCVIVIAAALFLLFSHLGISAFAPTAVGAADQRSYGEKKGIATAEEALKVLEKHFAKKDIFIGEIIEKELYFEAEIKDQINTVIDKVIVDKRTGRIRSIY